MSQRTLIDRCDAAVIVPVQTRLQLAHQVICGLGVVSEPSRRVKV